MVSGKFCLLTMFNSEMTLKAWKCKYNAMMLNNYSHMQTTTMIETFTRMENMEWETNSLTREHFDKVFDKVREKWVTICELQVMFPHMNKNVIEKTLQEEDGNVENTLNTLDLFQK